MFRSVKLKKIRIVLLTIFGVLLIAVICLAVLRGKSGDAAVINGENVSLSAECEADVEAFLTVCGYESSEFLFEHEITVPKQWNETYEAYNDLQRQQGFDLVPYKGKPATEYVYFVSDARNAVVLVSDNRIIATHISECDGSEMKILS